MGFDSSAPIASLVQDCARGDARAWEEFVGRYSRAIAIALWRTVSPAGSADGETEARADLVQEVWLRLLANDRRVLREFRGATEIALVAYLARVARSVALDDLRSRGARKRFARLVSLDDEEGGLTDGHSSAPRAPEATSPDRIVDDSMLRERVLSALREVLGGKSATRNLIIAQLYLFEQMTPREIASVPGIGLGVQGVESVINRTRARLREKFAARDGFT